ncbi:hypothetical protein AVEN_200828-1, partial [Araneus ventricosus]
MVISRQERHLSQHLFPHSSLRRQREGVSFSKSIYQAGHSPVIHSTFFGTQDAKPFRQ